MRRDGEQEYETGEGGDNDEDTRGKAGDDDELARQSNPEICDEINGEHDKTNLSRHVDYAVDNPEDALVITPQRHHLPWTR